jgi:hypothetical protein
MTGILREPTRIADSSNRPSTTSAPNAVCEERRHFGVSIVGEGVGHID